MPTLQEQSIFKKGSNTYYYSSIFFPKHIKDDVFTLYGFVRTADDYVDAIPQQTSEFYDFKNETDRAIKQYKSSNTIIDRFVKLLQKKSIKREWVFSFLNSMEADITKNTYETMDELEQYIYGSAEVIGLMMSKILDLPEESFQYAAMQGKAMQLINFIRDIQEDNELGRQYIPTELIKKYQLTSLRQEDIKNQTEEFKQLVRYIVDIYKSWQVEAEKGYAYIPKRYLIPIKTAADMFNHTADIIAKRPLIVYSRKVKPSKWTIVSRIVYNTLFA